MKALLHFRNLDSTLDLNQQLAGFIKRGILSGGLLLPIPGQLKVDVTGFKLMGVDGMVVIENASATRLDVVAGRTNVIALKSKYMEDQDPIIEFKVMDITSYNADIEKDYLCVFATVTLGNTATEVTQLDISYQTRDVVEPVGRSSFRGYISSPLDAVVLNARPGDFYIVTSGSGDMPAIFAFNGVSYENITDSVVIASLLNAHRNSLFSNERHLSDAQAGAALGSAGSPSLTNKYVTEQDPRLPSQDENDALTGLPSSPAPSGLNPFVTASYTIAQPTEIELPVGAPPVIQLFPAYGPFYVGMGDKAEARKYFKFYHTDSGGEPREFTDSVTGQPVQVLNIYTHPSLGAGYELYPGASPAILNDNGFYDGSLYITYSGTLAYDTSRILFGKKTALSSIDRGMFIKPTPMSAQTSQESVLKAQEISGYKFDETVSTPETNKELRKSVVELLRYLETGTNTSYVVDTRLFPKLRETSFATDFEADYGVVTVMLGNVPYTVVQSDVFDAAYTTFDAALNASNTDSDYTALINYTGLANGILSVKPGHLFVDQAGLKFRVLAVNTTGNGSLLIYTGGTRVNTFSVGGTSVGSVIADNNPKQLELLADFQTSFGAEDFIFQNVEETKEIDGLPLGGIAVGTFATATTLPTTVLPKMGSVNGVHKGRKIFNVLPKKQGNRFDKRISLIGAWEGDGSYLTVGDNSALQYTGKVNNLTIWIDKTADIDTAAATAQFFVDGAAYGSPITLADAASYPHTDLLKTAQKKFALHLPVGSLDNNIHTIRVEFSTGGVTVPVYGMEVYYSSFSLEKGRVHNHISFAKQDTQTLTAPDNSTHTASKKTLYYMDSVSGSVQTASALSKEAVASGGSVTPFIAIGSTSFTNVLLENKLKLGDIMLFSVLSSGTEQGLSNTAIRRITNKTFSSPVVFELDAAMPFPLNNPSNSLIQQLFTIPVDSSGAPKLQAVGISDEYAATKEYARWKLADLSVGNSNDVGDINPFAEDRCTSFTDGSTSVSVRQCQKTTTDLTGYEAGVQFVNTNSSMTMQVWGPRADIVFAGKNGPTTLDITVDGFKYTVSLKGNGVERHTLYFDANASFHVIKLDNAATPTNVVVAEWILCDLKTPQVTGVPLVEVVRKGSSNVNYVSSNTYTAGFTNRLPSIGYRYLDFSKFAQTSAFGIGGTKDWYYEFDNSANTLHGYVLKTDRDNASVTFTLPKGVDPAQNYLLYKLGTSYTFKKGNPVSDVTTDALTNSVTYTFSNPSNSLITVYGLAVLQDGIVQTRNLDDKSSNYLNYSGFKDLRNYLSISPENVGVTQGEGSGTGTTTTAEAGIGASIEPFSGYDAIIFDEFSTFPNLPASTINSSLSNAAYNPQTKTYRLKCDKNTFVTMASTAYTLNTAPSFDLKPGDIIHVAGVVRKIVTVTSTTTGTVDAVFPSAVVSVQCMVSQAVWTKDLTAVGDSTQATRPMDIFPGASVNDGIIYYEDSLAIGDTTYDKADISRLAVIGASAGTQGNLTLPASTDFGLLYKRPTQATIQESYSFPVSAANQRLFLCFFCNPDLPTVTAGANLLYYDVSFYNSMIDTSGGYIHSAYAMSDSSTTPKNCTIDHTSGVTILTLTNWTITQGVAAGETVGDVEVYIDGNSVSRFVSGTVPTTRVSWQEVAGRPDQIKFSHNLSLSPVEIEIKKVSGTKDYAPINRTLLANNLGIVVGTAAMVSAGVASYSSLQAAVDAATTDNVITVLNGTSITETVIVGKRVYIQGKGYGSYLNGSLTLAANYITVKGLRFSSGSVTGSGCQITECFFTTAPTDSGVANHIQGIEV